MTDSVHTSFLSIVVPVYNEATTIPLFHQRLSAVLAQLPARAEILFVNDGSTDQSAAVLTALQAADSRIGVLTFTRNFGKEIALSAGLDYAAGDAVIVMDVDLQDPPELIPEMHQHWQAGSAMVYTKRLHRNDETVLKKYSSKLFYKLLGKLTPLVIPTDARDFRLLDRTLVNHLRKIRETHRFMKGLFSWLGYEPIVITYEAAPRSGGQSKWNYGKLFALAIEGLTSFSIVPLRWSTYLGFATAGTAFLYALWTIYKTCFFGEPVAGYPSLMVVILFLGGVQLMALGIMGEYVGRTFMESKQRPLYLLRDYKPAAQSALEKTERP